MLPHHFFNPSTEGYAPPGHIQVIHFCSLSLHSGSRARAHFFRLSSPLGQSSEAFEASTNFPLDPIELGKNCFQGLPKFWQEHYFQSPNSSEALILAQGFELKYLSLVSWRQSYERFTSLCLQTCEYKCFLKPLVVASAVKFNPLTIEFTCKYRVL